MAEASGVSVVSVDASREEVYSWGSGTVLAPWRVEVEVRGDGLGESFDADFDGGPYRFEAVSKTVRDGRVVMRYVGFPAGVNR